MIARLRGRLSEKTAQRVVVDVGGVGYRVFCPLSTFYRLPDKGEETVLNIHTHVSDSAINLFGFWTGRELNLFTKLLGVSGIGPKLALNILSGMDAPDLARALAEGDAVRIQAIPGVGRKTAERMVVELKDKAAQFGWLEPLPDAADKPEPGTDLDDAVSVLLNLGYQKTKAEGAVKKAANLLGSSPGLEALVKEALRILAR